MSEGDFEYFSARARAERLLSMQSANLRVAAVHRELADQYERRAGVQKEPGSLLRLVTEKAG